MSSKSLKPSNVIDFERHKFIKDLSSLRFITVYAVRANAQTGEWMEEPYSTGEALSSEVWCAQEDTASIHFTTFEPINPHTGETEVAGLMVNWVGAEELN